MHKNEDRKNRYLKRHGGGNENWNDPNTAGYWSAKYLWYYPTYKQAYTQIKKN